MSDDWSGRDRALRGAEGECRSSQAKGSGDDDTPKSAAAAARRRCNLPETAGNLSGNGRRHEAKGPCVSDCQKTCQAKSFGGKKSGDKEDVRDYLYGVDAGRLAGIMTNAGIRMSVFPHLYGDGVVLPEEGFDTSDYNDVPLIMLTGSSEFSIFAKGDPYFADAGDLVEGDKSAEYKFALKYGSELYGLFNAEESAVKMIDKYDAPIYTCDFDFGTDEELMGKEQANLIGASHGVFIPFLSGIAAGSAAGDGSAYEYEGPKELTQEFQDYIGNFLRTGDPNGDGLVTWEAWTGAEEGPSQLLLNADKDQAIVEQSYDRASYDEILDRMEADDSISEEAKKEIISKVLNGRWFSAGLDKRFGNANLWEQ